MSFVHREPPKAMLMTPSADDDVALDERNHHPRGDQSEANLDHDRGHHQRDGRRRVPQRHLLRTFCAELHAGSEDLGRGDANATRGSSGLPEAVDDRRAPRDGVLQAARGRNPRNRI